MTRFFGALGLVCLVVGVVLIVATDSKLTGALLSIAGLVIGAMVSAFSMGRRVYRSAREWGGLVRSGGPESVHIVSVQPPKGIIFNRDAVVTLEVVGDNDFHKRVERDLPVPVPQAAMWKLAGRVPTPIGYLTEARDLNVAIWKRRSRGNPEAAIDGSQE